MKFQISFLAFLISYSSYSQQASQIIAEIQKVQKNLHAISYTLQRSDTFVTGDTRIIKGNAFLKPVTNDSVFGFLFWGERDGINRFAIYDGAIGYDVNNDAKKYDIHTGSSILHILGAPGGQMVVEDLAILDTSDVLRYEVFEDAKFFYLTMHYTDIKEYDVVHRCKALTIDKGKMLPVAVRKHQETLGKVQHLKYEIKNLRLNNEALAYDFETKSFLEKYSQEIPQTNKALLSLKEKRAPSFNLISFTGSSISISALKDKVVLLDFWEVWCGPCIASMPKVQALYKRYNNKGLEVYGITNDAKQIHTAKRLIEKKQITFPMLIGNTDVQKKV